MLLIINQNLADPAQNAHRPLDIFMCILTNHMIQINKQIHKQLNFKIQGISLVRLQLV